MGVGTQAGRDPGALVWAELSESMRRLRQAAGHSIRWAETHSGRGRGLLSQIETGKARPNRALVEWYDDVFSGHGLLRSLYFEARTAHGPDSAPPPTASAPMAVPAGAPTAPPTGAPTASPAITSIAAPGPATASSNGHGSTSALQVVGQYLPAGMLVAPASEVTLGWTLRNAGSTAWSQLRLRRVGAPASPRTLGSVAQIAVPDCAAGAECEVRTAVHTPAQPGDYIAYWELADATGRALPSVDLVTCVLLVRP